MTALTPPCFLRTSLLALTIAALTACGGTTQKYYRLSADGAAPLRTEGMRIGVGPITLPGYVDRAELVFQNGANEFQVPPDAHWTGSLKENISRVLADDLGQRLNSGNVLAFPWDPNAKLRYQVAVDVAQFHAVSGQGTVLEVSWRVQNPGGQTLSRHNGSYRERVEGDGYDAVVAAQSRLLSQLANDIAKNLGHR